MPSISSLLTAKEMCSKLKGVVPAGRLVELAESGLAPHYKVDDRIFFGAAETQEWVLHNLVQRCPGKHIGLGGVTVVNVTPPAIGDSEVPLSLRGIAGMLIPMAIQSVESSGISGVYFLCQSREVVYVGQSQNVFGRVGAHIGAKTFDAVFFARVPISDLNYVEGELIKALRPKYNINSKGRLLYPGIVDGLPEEASVSCVEAVRGAVATETEVLA